MSSFLLKGSIDPLDALADVAREEEMWYHVDAGEHDNQDRGIK
jgi:cysteine sulfinate desulfinase/cysteine desulfurase-like protein